MSDLVFLPAYQLRQLLLKKSISAVELLAEFSQQIGKVNGRLNGLVTLDLEAAQATTKQLDEYQARHNTHVGYLHGLPLAVKDIFNTKGLLTTYGNPNFANFIPTQDDILTGRERAAGAVIVGKSNTPDCASGGITQNTLFGLTHNPWHPEKTTSGSGGGGISSLMGGMVALADGSDIGGSVRSPACWSHCVGYRPTSGIIPGMPGQAADGDTSTAGVFARCVTDAAMFVDAVQGPSSRSSIPYPSNCQINWQDLALKDTLPIAWQAEFAHMQVDSQIAKSFAEQAPVLEQAGLTLSHGALPLDDNYRDLFRVFNSWRFFACLPPVVQQDALNGRGIRSHNAYGEFIQTVTALEIQTMLLARDVLKTKFQAFFKYHSAIATPVHAGMAFGVDDSVGEAETDWAPLYLAPLLGLPSIVVPCGFTDDSMPNGIMFTGPAGSDQQLLQIAKAFEDSRGLPIGQPDLTWAMQQHR